MGVVGQFVDPIISAALQRKREKMLTPDVEGEDTLLQHLVRQTSGMLPSSILHVRLMERQTTNLLKIGRAHV